MTDEKRTQLIKLLGMLGSDHDGEVVNAARLAQRLMGQEGLMWGDVVGAKGNGNGKGSAFDGFFETNKAYNDGYAAGYAKACQEDKARRHTKIMTWFAFVRELRDEYNDNLTDWEQGFVESFIGRGFARPTPKQRDVFERIAEKLGIDLPE